MKFLKPINEYLRNENLTYYLYDKMKEDFIKSFPNNDVTFDKYPHDFGISFELFGNFVSKYTPKVNKLLNKWVTKFNDNELLFSFDEKSYTDKGRLYYWYNCMIKTLKIKRVLPPKYIYHTSLVKNRDFIKENGLTPTENKDWPVEIDYPAVVFASMDEKDLFDLDKNRDIYKIDTTGLDNIWYQDLNLNTLNNYAHDKYIMSFKGIPKENITLLSEI